MASSFDNVFLFPSLSLQQSSKSGVKPNLIFNFAFKTALHKATASDLSHNHLHTPSFAAPKSALHLIYMGWALQQANESPPSGKGRWCCTWGELLSNKKSTSQSTP